MNEKYIAECLVQEDSTNITPQSHLTIKKIPYLPLKRFLKEGFQVGWHILFLC